MSRGRRPRDAGGVALFPFLAVLLCTMGALIVLLVVIARQAEAQARDEQLAAATEKSRAQQDQRRQAQTVAQASVDGQSQALRTRAHALATVLETKQQAAARLLAELTAAQQKLRQLQEQQRDLERLAKERPSDDELRRQLTDLDERLRQAQAILSQRQRSAAATPQELYSIVPYAGRNGEARRPIYIECRGDRIILQPEGTELSAADFETLGPGNPLEAVVRVTASAWKQSTPAETNPYPLLLVRPDGVQAYHAARDALSTWGQEFGYELVDQDWKLAYPPADPVLAQQQQMAVTLGRQQMELLAKSQNRRRRSSPSFRVSSSGSLERVGGGGGDDDGGFGNRGAGGPGGSGHFGDSNQRGGGVPGGSDSNRLAGTGDQPGGGESGPVSGGAGNARAPHDPFSKLVDQQHPQGFPHGQAGSPFGQGGTPPFGQPGAPPLGQPGTRALGQPGGAQGFAGGATSEGSSFAGGPGGDAGQRPPGGQRGAGSSPFGGIGSRLDHLSGNQPTSSASSGTMRQGANTPGGANNAGGNAAASAGGSPGGSPGGGPTASGGSFGPGGSSAFPPAGADVSAGNPGGASSQGMPDESPPDTGFSMNAAVTPIAQQQGTNWALPSKPGRGASPLRRDVHLLVDAGAVTVFVDPRSGQTLKIVRIGPDPEIALGELKDAVWTIMKDWGNAPAGFYWRPVLRTQVTARGAPRVAQLETLLQDSGFEVGR